MDDEPIAAEERIPQVVKHTFVNIAECSAADLLGSLPKDLGLTAEQLERVLWHQGLYVDRQRWPVPGLTTVGAGVEVTAYRFVAEPPPVEISDAAILLRRDDLLAVDKPAGLTVQGTRASVRYSLEAQLRERLGMPWLTPVHRLDRQTTGVNVFAETPEVAEVLGRQFRERRVQKHYLAWVSPRRGAPWPPPPSFSVEGEMIQVPHPQHARYALVDAGGGSRGGRPSRSAFDVLSEHPGAALLRCAPQTGRTHQLRVHLSSRGWPIVGDSLYGSPVVGALRLHAEVLTLRDAKGELLTLRAPIPADFAEWDQAPGPS